MQTLRFYTRRIFAVVCTFFFLFLIFMATRRSSNEGAIEEAYFARRFGGGKPVVAVLHRQGEQLPFQSQPPPALDTTDYVYSELGIKRIIDDELVDRLKAHIKNIDLERMAFQECRKNITLAEHWLKTESRIVPQQDSWERFYAQIGTCDLYHDEKTLNELLTDLAKRPIVHTAIMEGGTQVKLILTFDNGKQAVFKPMRYGRDYETDPNHFYFGDFERHTAEIATFHMDKILGYRRAVPTVGRVMNMTEELRDKADKRLKKTFFVSPAKNHCFVSKCDYYCDTTHAICGTPDLKEGSVQAFLPDDTTVPRKHNRSPYRRTYSKKAQIAEWQQDMQYCNYNVKTIRQYAHGRRLLDLIDLHIMDFLIINQDRHHYETFSVFPSDTPSYALHLDNGRAFGRTDIDDEDILMPLRQCCVIRPSTLLKLLEFYSGPKGLTEMLHESLKKDPVMPVLAFKHYIAIERRLHKIMRFILECMDRQPGGSLAGMVMTEFHNDKVSAPLPGGDIDATEDETDDDAAAGMPAAVGPAPPKKPGAADARLPAVPPFEPAFAGGGGPVPKV